MSNEVIFTRVKSFSTVSSYFNYSSIPLIQECIPESTSTRLGNSVETPPRELEGVRTSETDSTTRQENVWYPWMDNYDVDP